MIQFLRKLFGLDARVPADAPVDMPIVPEPAQEAPVPAKPKRVAKPKGTAAKRKPAPKKEKAVSADKPAPARRGRPKKS